MLKKMICIALLLFSTSLWANEYLSFDTITQNLAQGKAIRVVINTNYCNVSDPNPYKIPKQTMVTTPNTVIFTDDLLSFSAQKYSHGRDPLPPGGLMQRGSFLMNKHGDVSLVLSFFDAQTQKQSENWKNVKIACHLLNGVHVYEV